jgi:SAM-dependent methyltransferase
LTEVLSYTEERGEIVEKGPEFDHYAQNYKELLRDPVRDGFVRSGEFYHRRKWTLIAEFLADHAISPRQLAWLDVGCGKGELLSYGRSHFGHVAGCDPSREMSRDAGGIDVRLQEAPTALPFPNASFDFATAVCVYHHVEEKNRIPLTREIHRILRPNGIFCMIEHNPFNPITRLIVSQCPIDVDAHLLSARLARSYTDKVGLRHVESQYFLYVPEWFYDRFGGMERIVKRLPLGGQYAIFAGK